MSRVISGCCDTQAVSRRRTISKTLMTLFRRSSVRDMRQKLLHSICDFRSPIKLTNSHCIVQLAEAGDKSRGEAGDYGAPDEDNGSTIGRDFAADSLQVQQTGGSRFNC